MYKMPKCHMNFHIAGFQYHDGYKALPQLKPGTKLKLVAEPDNPFDSCAVAIYYKDIMLGYIPQDQNFTVAQLLHFGHANVFKAVVLSVDPNAPTNKQVYVSIRVRDAR